MSWARVPCRAWPHGCESALEAGPRLEPIQAIEFLAKSRRLGGSRSAPIGTPPRTKFILANQRAKAGWRWGPYSGLIHTDANPLLAAAERVQLNRCTQVSPQPSRLRLTRG